MTLKSLTLTEAPTTIIGVEDFIVKEDAEYAEGSAYMYATGPRTQLRPEPGTPGASEFGNFATLRIR